MATLAIDRQHDINPALGNQPFDPRILSRPMAQFSRDGLVKQNLFRGYITRTEKPFYRLNFLYNPSIVTVNHSVDADNGNLLPQMFRPDDPTTTPLLPLNSGVSFSLLFDRTFELWDSKYVGTPLGQQGVLNDVLALYRIVGISQPSTVQAGSEPADITGTQILRAGTKLSGVMQYVPVRAYFASTVRTPTPLAFYGVINSAAITYTHWSQDMVPQRCSVDISMTLLPETVSSPTQSTTTKSQSTKPKPPPAKGSGDTGDVLQVGP